MQTERHDGIHPETGLRMVSLARMGWAPGWDRATWRRVKAEWRADREEEARGPWERLAAGALVCLVGSLCLWFFSRALFLR